MLRAAGLTGASSSAAVGDSNSSSAGTHARVAMPWPRFGKKSRVTTAVLAMIVTLGL